MTCVLEIGPGIGTMTQYLAEGSRTGDRSGNRQQPAARSLQETLADYANVTVINQDILKVDINEAGKGIQRRHDRSRLLPICHITLPHRSSWDCLKAMCRSTTSRLWCRKKWQTACRWDRDPRITAPCLWQCSTTLSPYIVANVPPNCFIPRPNVGSAVIRLTRYQEPPVQVKDPKLMFKLIRASFNQRRKTLQNGLNNSPEISFSKEEITKAIESLGVSPSVRGEALSLEQFAQLANYFVQ